MAARAPALDRPVGAAELLARLAFYALPDPTGAAIALAWDLPDPASSPDDLPLAIVRRDRRFPGLHRRGGLPVPGTDEDLRDGLPVYHSAAFRYDFEEVWEEHEGDLLVVTAYQFVYSGTPRDRVLVRVVRREFPPGAAAPSRTTVRVIDRDALVPGTLYYYTAFVGAGRLYSAQTQSAALATGRTARALFDLLPGVHRRLDESLPPPGRVALADAGKGQLQRLLEVFDAHADMLQGMAAALRDLHNPRRVDSRLLPALAHLLGWRLKGYLDEDGQRTEIRFAPEVYRTVGTPPNLAAMINRLTGWDTRLREFAASIVVSFDALRLEALEDGTLLYLDGRVAAAEAPPPYLTGDRLPAGSVDTVDVEAMARLRARAFDDTTAYTYDCGRPDGAGGYVRDNDTWYSRETVGVYIVPDVPTELFALQEEWERVREIIAEFLPIQVRVVFVVQPGVEVEEAYNALTDVQEDVADLGIEWGAEVYTGLRDAALDQIPGLRRFITNDEAHRAVDTAADPVDTRSRTWHTGLGPGLRRRETP